MKRLRARAFRRFPIQNEIAWSKNSAKYLALLGDFALLQKQIEAIPGPGLRYSSELLPYVPDHTAVYASIPNISATLGEASQLFEERLQQSPALRSWWKEQQHGKGPKISDVVSQLQSFSSYLGDEIVFAVARDGANYSSPVVLAKVRQPGLESFLQAEMKRVNKDRTAAGIAASARSGGGKFFDGQAVSGVCEERCVRCQSGPGELRSAVARLQKSSASHFSETPLYQQVVHSYQQGAGWLLCADMEQIVAEHVHEGSDMKAASGIGDARYLMMERREVGGKTENRAALTFASDRRGIASWLAAPGPMGALEFVSPDASMVNAAVTKNPRSIMEEMFTMMSGGNPNFAQDLAKFESKTGVSVLDDITAPLGGEIAFAFDGPVLPTPRWKVIFEVYDPARMQSTVGKLVDEFQPGSDSLPMGRCNYRSSRPDRRLTTRSATRSSRILRSITPMWTAT